MARIRQQDRAVIGKVRLEAPPLWLAKCKVLLSPNDPSLLFLEILHAPFNRSEERRCSDQLTGENGDRCAVAMEKRLKISGVGFTIQQSGGTPFEKKVHYAIVSAI